MTNDFPFEIFTVKNSCFTSIHNYGSVILWDIINFGSLCEWRHLPDLEAMRHSEWPLYYCSTFKWQVTFFSTVLVNIVPIVDFIKGLCSNTFDTIINDPEHRLNRLIQFSGPAGYALRCNRHFIVPKCKTDGLRNSFIIRSGIDKLYT